VLVGLLSDVHEDIIRLEEGIEILKKRKVEEIICLGDMIGFCIPYCSYMKTRDSNRVVELIKNTCQIVVKGNHDLFAIRKIPDYIYSFKYPSNWYDLDYKTRKELSNDKVWLYEENELYSLLTDNNKAYIDNITEYAIKDYGKYKILFSHYAYPDYTGSSNKKIKKISDLKSHFKMMDEKDCLYSFSGHEHFEGIKIFTKDTKKEIPFEEKYILPNEPLWINGPALSNSVLKNGVIIYNAKTREVEAIPLNT